jgi:hypothetical protein
MLNMNSSSRIYNVGDTVVVLDKEKLLSECMVISNGTYRHPSGVFVPQGIIDLCDSKLVINHVRFTDSGTRNYSCSGCHFSFYDWMFDNLSDKIFVLRDGDRIIFDGSTSVVTNESSSSKKYYLASYKELNCYMFSVLRLNVTNFTRSILGYHDATGSFPECKSLEDLTTLALALAEEYYKKGLEVKFERKSSKDASI